MGSPSSKSRLLGRTYAVPVILASLSGAGLVFALVGDDAWDALSWLLLFLPVAVAAWFLAPAQRRQGLRAIFLRRISEVPPNAS